MTIANIVDAVMMRYFQQESASRTTAGRMLGSVISSLSFNLTLKRRFETSSMLYSPVTRRQIRNYDGPVGASVHIGAHTETVAKGRPVTYLNRFPPESFASSTSSATSPVGMTATSPDYIEDTSSATRDRGSKYGECKMSQFKITSLPREQTWVQNDAQTFLEIVGVGIQYSKNFKTLTIGTDTCSAFLDEATLSTLRQTEELRLNQIIAERGSRLVISALPNHRDMSLFRSLVELRDLPRTLKSTLEQLMSLGKGTERIFNRAGDSHLTVQFGWAPLVSDVQKVMDLLDTLPARINRLQSREFMPSTFHSTQSFWDENVPTTALMIPYNPALEKLISAGTLNSRRVQLRASVNCYLRLPDISPFPYSEKFKFTHLYGLNPTVADIYALTPWTWLFDWFSGLGEYITCLIALNEEPSLINHGCVSAKSTLYLNSTSTHEMTGRRVVKRGTTTIVDETTKYRFGISGKAELVTYTRMDASKIPDVACTSTMTGLSTWQASILSALFATRYL